MDNYGANTDIINSKVHSRLKKEFSLWLWEIFSQALQMRPAQPHFQHLPNISSLTQIGAAQHLVTFQVPTWPPRCHECKPAGIQSWPISSSEKDFQSEQLCQEMYLNYTKKFTWSAFKLENKWIAQKTEWKNIKTYVAFHIFLPKWGGWILSLCKSPLNDIHVNDAVLIYTTGEISFPYAWVSVHICPLRINK